MSEHDESIISRGGWGSLILKNSPCGRGVGGRILIARSVVSAIATELRSFGFDVAMGSHTTSMGVERRTVDARRMIAGVPCEIALEITVTGSTLSINGLFVYQGGCVSWEDITEAIRREEAA